MGDLCRKSYQEAVIRSKRNSGKIRNIEYRIRNTESGSQEPAPPDLNRSGENVASGFFDRQYRARWLRASGFPRSTHYAVWRSCSWHSITLEITLEITRLMRSI